MRLGAIEALLSDGNQQRGALISGTGSIIANTANLISAMSSSGGGSSFDEGIATPLDSILRGV